MSYLTDCTERRDAVYFEIARMAEREQLTPAEQQKWHQLTREHTRLDADVKRLRARAGRMDDIRSSDYTEHPGMPESLRDRGGSDRLSSVQGSALRALDAEVGHFTAWAADRMEQMVRSDPAWAARFEACSRPEYLSGFGKFIMHGEQASMMMSTLSVRPCTTHGRRGRWRKAWTTTGGFAVPTVLDPTVILTDQETGNVMLQVCRTEEVQTNVWKGVKARPVQAGHSTLRPVRSPMTASRWPSQVSLSSWPAASCRSALRSPKYWQGFQSEMARNLGRGLRRTGARQADQGLRQW